MRLFTKLFAVATLTFPFALAPAQDLGSLLRDSKHPQKIKPSELGEDMRAMKITFEKQGGGGDIFSMMMNPMMMMMGAFGSMGGGEAKPADPDQAAGMMFVDRLGISWTNGATVKLYEQDFLVTYSVQINMAEAMKSKSPPRSQQVRLDPHLDQYKGDLVDHAKERYDQRGVANPAPVPPPAVLTARDKTSTLSNIKQMGTAMIIYMADYDDVFPYVQSTKGAYELLMPYSKNVEIFKSLNPNSGEFRLNMSLAGVNQTIIENPSDFPMFYEAEAWPDGDRAVVFADTSAKFVSPERWAELAIHLSVKLQKTGKPLPASLGSNWPKIGGIGWYP